jgi:hypothetical protein
MSTGTIIAIVVIALVILAVVAFFVPRMQARSRERQVARRREEVAGAHREVAEERLSRAQQAERVARAERAEAEVHQSRAELHEEGLADDQLDDDHRRFVRERDGETGTVGEDAAVADQTRGTTR